jgi:3-oxo-4,17-pregnadiene-20-carboxyl-CoA hydratase beta subunit
MTDRMPVLAPTRTAGEVPVGTALPELALPITPTFIISTAIATRDYQDVHHDRDAALQRGARDIFMNILTTTGLVQRYVTDWAGPEALVKAVSIRLGAPNFPGDTMTLTGQVVDRADHDGGAVFTIEVRGANRLGDHVTGEVRIALPVGGAR